VQKILFDVVMHSVHPAEPSFDKSVHKWHTPEIKVDIVSHIVQDDSVHVRQFALQAVHAPALSKYPRSQLWHAVKDVHALQPNEHAEQYAKSTLVELKKPTLQAVHKLLSLHVLQLGWHCRHFPCIK
jgi:hypothetical protein